MPNPQLSDRPVMIFHVPYPLQQNPVAASGIRPKRMREAFEALGYDVWEISGVSRERRKTIREIRSRVRSGARVEFVYSESSTMPTPLTDPKHLPLHPRLDLVFLRFCRRAGIPVGLFYRDLYWMFEDYSESVPAAVAVGTRWFYRRDLRWYRDAIDRLFVPSMQMANYLPEVNRAQAAPLPPGSDRIAWPNDQHTGLNLLFVGGLGGHYRLHECVRGVQGSRDARLVICTRSEQWAGEAASYAELLGARTQIEHRSGQELQQLFEEADLGVLFLEPSEYREFAAPLKLYEYVGNGKPVIVTEGSLAATFVADHGVGWVLPYEAGALTKLLDRLSVDPDEVAMVRERTLEVAKANTWEARAAQAAQMLRPDVQGAQQ